MENMKRNCCLTLIFTGFARRPALSADIRRLPPGRHVHRLHQPAPLRLVQHKLPHARPVSLASQPKQPRDKTQSIEYRYIANYSNLGKVDKIINIFQYSLLAFCKEVL